MSGGDVPVVGVVDIGMVQRVESSIDKRIASFLPSAETLAVILQLRKQTHALCPRAWKTGNEIGLSQLGIWFSTWIRYTGQCQLKPFMNTIKVS